MRIFLIGFMGSGKTSIGKKLAGKLSLNFVDLDKYIEAKNFRTITHLFEEAGENKFREIEHKALMEVSEFENVVVATGGGTPCFYNNLELMNTRGVTVYLKMNPGALTNRLKNSKKVERPLIKGLAGDDLAQFIGMKLTEREKYYEQAKYVVDALDVKLDNLALLIQNN